MTTKIEEKVTKKMETMYFIRREGENKHSVLKVCLSENCEADFESVYTIIDGVCSCSSFEYRGNCKHVAMLAKMLHKGKISVKESRHFVQQLISKFKLLFEIVDMAEEPYIKDEKGLVEGIVLVPKRFRFSKKVFAAGEWEVVDESIPIRVFLLVL